MGGSDSAVTSATIPKISSWNARFFHRLPLPVKPGRYGLHTDSSHRFERGVDPDLQHKAIERATKLILEIAGGRAGPVTEVKDEAALPDRPIILLRSERVQAMLGISLPDQQIEEYFAASGHEGRKTGRRLVGNAAGFPFRYRH